MADTTLNIPISESTQKKLRAYAMLTGQNVAQIEDELSSLLDQVLTKQCFELLGGMEAFAQGPYREGDNIHVHLQPNQADVQTSPRKKPRGKKNKTFADAHREVAGKRTEEAEPEEAFSQLSVGKDEISGHELSGDVDDGNNKSLAEQTGEDNQEDDLFLKAFESTNVQDVGEDAEAFADAALGVERDEEHIDRVPSVQAQRRQQPQRPPQRQQQQQPQRAQYPVQRPQQSLPLEYGPPQTRSATKSFESRLKKGQTARVAPFTGEED